MNGKNEYCMRAVLQTVDLLLDLLDEADPASAGSCFYTSPKCSRNFRRSKAFDKQ